MEQEHFRDILAELLRAAQEQEGVLTREEIAGRLPDLTEEQFSLVAAFLAENQIRVRGTVMSSDFADPTAKKELLAYAEESAYFGMYYEELKKIRALSDEEEDAVFLQAKAGDAKAKKKLIEANLMLVAETALLFRDQGSAIEDLIQEGNLGLMMGLEEALCGEEGNYRKILSQAILEALENTVYEDNAQENVGKKSIARAESIREGAKLFEKEFGYAPSRTELSYYLEMDPEELADSWKLAADENDFFKEAEEDEPR